MTKLPEGCGATNVEVRRCKILPEKTLQLNDVMFTRGTCKRFDAEIIYLCKPCLKKFGVIW